MKMEANQPAGAPVVKSKKATAWRAQREKRADRFD
jgi:hypothetical protein